MFTPSLQRLWCGIICLWLVIGMSGGMATAQPAPDNQAGSGAPQVLVDTPPATLANSYHIVATSVTVPIVREWCYRKIVNGSGTGCAATTSPLRT